MKITLFICTIILVFSCGSNSGGKWKPTSIRSKEHGMLDNYHSDGVEFLVVSGKNILAVTQEEGVFLSSDEGVTWTKTSLKGIPETVKINTIVADGTMMVAGTKGSGVFISDDSGKTWKQKNSGLCDTIAYKKFCAESFEQEMKDYWKNSPEDHSAKAAEFSEKLAELEHPDIQKYLDRTLDVASVAIGGNTIYVYLSFAVFASSDNGDNWSKLPIKEEILKSANPVSLAADENRVFAFCGDQLQRSDDKGKIWTSLFIDIPADTAFVGVNNTVQYEPKSINAIIPKGNTIYAGTSHGVFISSDKGDHWKEMNVGLPTKKPVCALAVLSKTIFVCPGEYQGVYISRNNGESWKAFNEGFKHNTEQQYHCGFINYFALTPKNIFAGIWTNGECRDALFFRSLDEIEKE